MSQCNFACVCAIQLMCVCCVHTCVHACVPACVSMFVCACVCMCVHVCACGHENIHALMCNNMTIMYLCGVIRDTYYIMQSYHKAHYKNALEIIA